MSENKKYFYLKLKDSFFSSEEMLILESLPDGLIYQNIYLRMCLLSLKNDGALTFKNMLPYDLKMLATVLRLDIAKVKLALEMFEQLGLVTKTDNEVLFMSDIQTLIGKSSTEADRIQRYRKRIASCTEGVQMLQNCTPEIETEIELKTELETESKDNCNGQIPSFEEVKEYCTEIKAKFDPRRFYNYYQGAGWMLGNNKMKDWRAVLRNWKLKDDTSNEPQEEKPKTKKEWVCKACGKVHEYEDMNCPYCGALSSESEYREVK